MSSLRIVLAGIFAAFAAAAPAFAGPDYSFSVSVGTQPSDVGVITLTQKTSNSVEIKVDLKDGYGFINTGGPHTPFAFNLQGTGTLSISTWTLPVNGVYSKGTFSLNTAGGDNTPYGTYGIAIDSSAGNGSGKGYFGDLQFTLSRTTSLSTDDFIFSSSGYYFSADLSDNISNGNTGAQAWTIRQIVEGPKPVRMPEPVSLALLGGGLAGIAAFRRRGRA